MERARDMAASLPAARRPAQPVSRVQSGRTYLPGQSEGARLDCGEYTFQIVRIESELVSPCRKLQILNEHQTVEYGPVLFQKTNTELWLPKKRGALSRCSSSATISGETASIISCCFPSIQTRRWERLKTKRACLRPRCPVLSLSRCFWSARFLVARNFQICMQRSAIHAFRNTISHDSQPHDPAWRRCRSGSYRRSGSRSGNDRRSFQPSAQHHPQAGWGRGLLASKDPLPADTLQACLTSGAVLLGAVGGPVVR